MNICISLVACPPIVDLAECKTLASYGSNNNTEALANQSPILQLLSICNAIPFCRITSPSSLQHHMRIGKPIICPVASLPPETLIPMTG